MSKSIQKFIEGIGWKVEDSKWDGKYYFHRSYSPEENENSNSYGISTSYESRNFGFRAAGLYIGEDYRSDLGYVRRNDIIKLYPEISYTIWPEKSKFLNHRFELTPVFILKPGLNNEISDIQVSIDKYKEVYDDVVLSKRLSDKKFKQIEGLEKLSILQKNYRGLKRKVTRNRLKMESIALLVVSIY